MKPETLVMLYHSHCRTYTGSNPATNAEWTQAERMADIVRQLSKVRAVLAFHPNPSLVPDNATIDEAAGDLGVADAALIQAVKDQFASE